jgi:hypothetical protein
LRIVTGLVCLLLLGVAGTALGWGTETAATGRRWIAGALLAGIPVAMAFSVLGYEVRRDAVHVRRPGRRTRIPLAGLQSVEVAPRVLSRSVRLMGNGGFFSFTGWFWNSRLGRYRLFANDARLAVVLRFSDRRVVVGPDDPAGFANAVREAARLEGDGGLEGKSPTMAGHGRA